MGHVTKHFAVLPHLKKNFDRFVFIGSETGPERDYIGNSYPFYALPEAKLKRKEIFGNLSLPIKLLNAERKSREIMKAERPSVVFCGGGYVSVPAAFAAHSLSIPVAVHESDRSAGLANRLCIPFSKAVFTTFPDTLKNNKKVINVGGIVRNELFAPRPKESNPYRFCNGKKTLLVIGGSLGSKTINDNVAAIYDELCSRYNVLHLCGKACPAQRRRKDLRVVAFTKDMADVYAATDIAVSRCGANTAFELMALGIPSLFIPLPKTSSRGDQIENAEYFKSIGAAHVLDESFLTPKTLLRAIIDLEDDYMRIKTNIKRVQTFDAAKSIAGSLVKISQGKSPIG